MNKILTIFILAILGFTGYAQDKTADELKALADNKQYDKVIEHAPKSKDYSARALYYIGLAYYMKENDNNCIKFMDLSIGKDAKDPAPYYIKASTLNYMGQYNEAVKNFETAISLNPEDAVFYSGLGDAYYHLGKKELALKSYQKATEKNDCPGRPYSMIAQIYSELNQNGKALEAFYIAKEKISKESGLESYTNALFNIGTFESLKGNHDKAEPLFLELIGINPTDYHSYSKLIQVYYHKKEYDKAKPYKEKLYEAHKQGKLQENLQDMFCFDQFKWKDYSVQVFERYENENKGKIYNKHVFYIVNNAGEIVLRVQTEFSPISLELGGPKYVLCASKGSVHHNSGLGFNDDFKYDNLKEAAIRFMEKLMK